jgi:hypothetical protein
VTHVHQRTAHRTRERALQRKAPRVVRGGRCGASRGAVQCMTHGGLHNAARCCAGRQAASAQARVPEDELVAARAGRIPGPSQLRQRLHSSLAHVLRRHVQPLGECGLLHKLQDAVSYICLHHSAMMTRSSVVLCCSQALQLHDCTHTRGVASGAPPPAPPPAPPADARAAPCVPSPRGPDAHLRLELPDRLPLYVAAQHSQVRGVTKDPIDITSGPRATGGQFPISGGEGRREALQVDTARVR